MRTQASATYKVSEVVPSSHKTRSGWVTVSVVIDPVQCWIARLSLDIDVKLCCHWGHQPVQLIKLLEKTTKTRSLSRVIGARPVDSPADTD